MKKFVFWASIAFVVSIAIYFASWSSYHMVKGDRIEVYHRLNMSDESTETPKTIFNLWGLLSPWQIEAQHIVTDTIYFTHRIDYPKAPAFRLVVPKDSTVEKMMAEEFANVYFDSTQSIRLRLGLDYDGTSKKVRDAAHPRTLTLAEPISKITTIATASPESFKDGWLASLQPNHIELENVFLSKDRLECTMGLFQKNLIRRGIDSIQDLDLMYFEYQLRSSEEAYQASIHPEMLDSMRFVAMNVQMIVERLEVTPMTLPVALPVWIDLGNLTYLMIASFIFFLRTRKWKKIDWIWLVKLLGYMCLAMFLIALTAFIFWMYKELIIWLLILFGIAIFLYLLYLLIKNWWDIIMSLFFLLLDFFEFIGKLISTIWEFLKWIFPLIGHLILIILLGILSTILTLVFGVILLIIAMIVLIGVLMEMIRDWWNIQHLGWKFFVVLATLNLLFIAALLLGWCHIVWTF